MKTPRALLQSSAAALALTVSTPAETPDFNGLNNSDRSVTRVRRHLLVTSTRDSGRGSLREAILDANDGCDRYDAPCRVLFQIPPPVPPAGWFTIRLSTPLPPITATNLILDGTAQTAFTGDTNPAGPEIDLSGGALAEGNGLEVRSAGDFEVSGLVISGFPENGILFDAASERSSFNSAYVVTGNYIGTDPTGTVAVANGLRGVAVFLDSPAANSFRWALANLTVRSSLISGNGRSGIFIDSGLSVSIENNRIGVKAASDEPLPNGASGVYFGIASGLGCVDHNRIAHNAHFGIALESNVPNVWIARNAIVGNGLYGVDIGLDLATPGGSNNVERRPLLTSARYDEGTGRTTIHGKASPSSTFYGTYMIDLYGNSSLAAKGEGETWLGDVQPSASDFTFVFDGNLLGKAITAALTRTAFNGFLVSGDGNATASLPLCQQQGFLQQTSELSDPIEVTR